MLRRHTGVTKFDTRVSTQVCSPLAPMIRKETAMFRYPALTIIGLVFLSMLLAVGYHRWQVVGESTLSSRTPRYDSAEDVFRQIASGAESDPLLIAEEKESCSGERLKYQKIFESMPVFLRERRSSAPADFPRSCILYIMKKKLQKWKPVDKKCAPGSPSCLTDEYVNVVYNAYGDVFSCLNVPQKELLPKFMTGNGLHLNQPLNVMGFQKKSAVIEKYMNEVFESEEASCRRIAGFIKSFQIDWRNACALISPPENPVLSFFIFAAFYKEIEKQILVDDDKIKQLLTFQALTETPQKVLEIFQKYQKEKKQNQSYQEFLSHHNRAAHEQFLRLYKAADDLEKAFKEGTCVSESFLAP
jgi:hypothetical protein